MRAIVFAALCLAGSACAAPFAYVPNEKSGTISVIDTATDTVVRQLEAGKRPRGIGSDPEGRQIFVSDASSGSLLAINNAAGSSVALALGRSPEGVSVSPDGKLVAVAVEEGNSVALFDAATHARLADIPVQGRNPEHAVFSPDSRYLYVSAEEAEQVDVIDVAQRRQSGSVAVGLRPRGIGFAPDSSRVLRGLRNGEHRLCHRSGDVAHPGDHSRRAQRQRHRRASRWAQRVCLKRHGWQRDAHRHIAQ